MCVRSSIAFYGNFNLDMDRSPGFGSAHTDYLALLRLGFPAAPGLYPLTLPVCTTRRTVLQKVRRRAYKALRQFVNTGFQVLFHSPPGVLCAIGHLVVFSLRVWSALLPSRFHVSRCTLDPAMSTFLSLTGLSPSLAGFPKTILLGSLNQLCSPNPMVHAPWFGLFRVRSPLLTESMFLSLPPAT